VGDEPVPGVLTLGQAFRAAYFMTEQYVALESQPDTGLVLYEQYLHSDPARWEDWKTSVRRAVSDSAPSDPLTENLNRDPRLPRVLQLLIDAVSDELHVVAGMFDIELTEQQFDNITAAVTSRLDYAFDFDWAPDWVKPGTVHTWPTEGGFRSRCGTCLADSPPMPEQEAAALWATDHEASHMR
jgi:hypothetical protein